MLKMVDVEYIRKKRYIEGWSIRKISRQLELSRQVVRKALKSSEIPNYKQKQARVYPVMDKYSGVVKQWLKEDEQAPRKQRHTAKRIYDRLVTDYGFSGVESTVRRYVAQMRPKAKEVFIPLSAQWGEQAQIDWGEAEVKIAGQMVTAHLFCLRLRASGVAFAWAAPMEKIEAFFEGHRKAFEWLGGVPEVCLYDNLKTAVMKILTGPHRQEQKMFCSLRAHYLFESRFCRPAQGHEKGAVENLVGYVRRNALVPVGEFASWETLNAHLLEWCERDRERLPAQWQAESAHLGDLPRDGFRCSVTRLAPVSRLSLVTIDHNWYSVPCQYVGRALRVEVFTQRIEVWDCQQLVANHQRCFGRKQYRLELLHYLAALERKPRAVLNALVINQLPVVYATARAQLCQGSVDGYREFAAIVLLHKEFPAQQVRQALEEAMARGCLQACVVKQILLNRNAKDLPLPINVPPALAEAKVSEPNLALYDHLIEEVAI